MPARRWAEVLLSEPVCDRVAGELHAVVQVRFLENVAHVSGDGSSCGVSELRPHLEECGSRDFGWIPGPAQAAAY